MSRRPGSPWVLDERWTAGKPARLAIDNAPEPLLLLITIATRPAMRPLATVSMTL